MMRSRDGEWLVLACDGEAVTEASPETGYGYRYRLAGVAAGGRIVDRWCRIVN